MVDTTIGLHIDNKTIYSVPIHLDRTTAIHFAAFQGHEDVVRLLIDYGAALNNEHTTMYTPLTLAAAEGTLSNEIHE